MNYTANITEYDWTETFLIESRHWVQKVLLPCIAFVGIVGNLLSIIVLTRKRMRSSTNTYLTALAVSDILILIFHMYLSFENYKIVKNNVDYFLYWQYWRFALWLDDASLGISVWLTVSFTCERYVAVCHPLKGKVLCTESRARKIIAFVFILCPLSVITTIFEYKIEMVDHPDKNGTSIVKVSESDLRQDQTYKTVFFWFIVITFVFVPLIILSVLNSLLINAVRKSRRRRSTLTQAKYNSSFKQRAENKITMTLVAVVFLFLVCQTPQVILLVLGIFYEPPIETPANNIIRGMGNVSNCLLAINAASNFILYCVMSDQYRRTLLRTLFPHYYKKKFDNNATLRSDASFRHSSFRQSSFMRSSSIRSDHRIDDRSPTEVKKIVIHESIKEGVEPNELLLKPKSERRVSLSPDVIRCNS